MSSEFGLRGTRWEIRSVTFSPHMKGQSMKTKLVQGCMGRHSSFRGSLDRESCDHHTFRHSFLCGLFHFHSSHCIIASSCTTYSSVIVVCCTCGSKIVPGQWPVGHVEVTNKVGIVNNFLEGCAHAI